MSIILKDIKKSFADNVVINNLSLKLVFNEIVCLLGPSGCGKTTLLNIIAGIIKQDSGTIKGVQGKSISYVFQENRLIPHLNIYDNVRIVLKNDDNNYILKNLELVMLKDANQRFAYELSGGMKRRASLARALAYDGDIFLLDEPFKEIDITTKNSIIDAMKEKLKTKAVLFVTHDIDEAISFSDKIYIISGPPFSVKEIVDTKSYIEKESIKKHIEDKIKNL